MHSFSCVQLLGCISFLCRGLTPPPAPLRPARRGAEYCHVLCCVQWWFDSCGAIRHPLPPFLATEGLDLHHDVHLRGRIPRNPLAPAPCRAWRISDGFIAYLAAIILIAQTNCLSRICITGQFTKTMPDKHLHHEDVYPGR